MFKENSIHSTKKREDKNDFSDICIYNICTRQYDNNQ